MKHLSFLFKAGLLVGLVLFFASSAAAQAPAWQSAQAVATATAAAAGNYSVVNSTVVDVAGNVFLAGHFRNSVVLGGTTLTSFGNYDVFVAKFNPANNQFVWAQRAGGTGADYATSLAVSGTSVYVAGEFGSSTARFGSITLTNAGANSGRGDVFVAKLTDTGSTGSVGWAQRAGGTGSDYATALVVSGTSLYVVGDFYGSTTRFGTATLTNAGASGADVFVAKLTDTGSFEWAQQAGGTGNDAAHALAVSGTRVFMAGDFNSPTASFGNITITNPTPNTSLGFLASLTDPTLTATAAGRALTPAQLFPNPARRTATLRLPAGTPSAPLTLTDALGRAVRRYLAPAAPETALDLSGLPAGLYLLRGAGPAQRLAVE